MPARSDIVAFVADYLMVAPDKIKPETLIVDDLGVDGDDGWEFIQEFSQRFDVDLSDYENCYFGPEGFPLLMPFIGIKEFLCGLLGMPEKHPMPPLSIRQLELSAEAGKWISI